MADSSRIIYLVVGSCYFSDEPSVFTKNWCIRAYESESDAWAKVVELRLKEKNRVVNLCQDDSDYLIRHGYTVDSILLFC